MFGSNEVVFLVVLAASHVWYAYVWLYPASFQRRFVRKGSDPVAVFEYCSVMLRGIQTLVFAWWVFVSGVDWTGHSVPQSIVGALLVACGQYLNYSVFKAIGVEGVYYGVRLGKKIDWFEGFPFTFVPHPQYVGGVLTLWGVVLHLINADHPGQSFPLIVFCVALPVFYRVTAYLEDQPLIKLK